MSGRSLINNILALIFLVGIIALSMYFLYKDDDKDNLFDADSDYLLAPAVPVDAVAVCFFSEAGNVDMPALAEFEIFKSLQELFSSEDMQKAASLPMALSLHYTGGLSPLIIFDAGEASPEPSEEAESLMRWGEKQGMKVSYVDCSTIDTDRAINGRSIVVMSQTETMIKTSIRNMENSLSVLDAPGFLNATHYAQTDDVVYVSYSSARQLFSNIVLRDLFRRKTDNLGESLYGSMAAFSKTVADWAVFSLSDIDDKPLSASGVQVSESSVTYSQTLAKMTPITSQVAEILPSYTFQAFTMPVSDVNAYVEGYETYLDSRQRLSIYQWKRKDFKSTKGYDPVTIMSRLGASEVAEASFVSGSDLLTVNLLKINNRDTLLLRGTGLDSFSEVTGKILPYAYEDASAYAFGQYFKLEDESCFTISGDWLVTGSREAVSEYASSKALSYTLKEYMSDAGSADLFAQRNTFCNFYMNLTEDNGYISKLLSKDLASVLKSYKGEADYSPLFLSVYEHNGVVMSDLDVYNLNMNRVKPPKYERDVEVVVSKGPFMVKNSGTGKMNKFFQDANGALRLQQEDGTGIWGVPFKGEICGTAQTVDYYANGKLQILFGSGSEIYLIDRLGRYVTGFPLNIGKEILLGPDVYDFNGQRRYNIMVLHKDNTIEMYNLKGKKPSSWKTIRPAETIVSLPERIVLGGNNFWVVRTSVQTLIYPFYGGTPLTNFEGSSMILPDSKVEVIDNKSVKVYCYDGNSRTVRLK